MPVSQELQALRDALEDNLILFFTGLPDAPTELQIQQYVNTVTMADFQRGKSISGLLHLPMGIQWVDQHQYQPVKRAVDKTMSGGLVVWETDDTVGQAITLESPDNGGWWSDQALVILKSMARQQGIVYVLMWQNLQTRVIFDNTESSATELSRLNPWASYWVGTLRLLTV
jgi:hypothetical protein